jgi:hypothetical protein
MGDRVDADILFGPFNGQIHIGEGFRIGSIWEWEQWRRSKYLFPYGKMMLVRKWSDHNLCTDEGLNNLMDVHFSAGTQITSWYVVIFEDSHTPAAGDTYAVPGFTESTAYDEATRPAWQEAGVSSKTITNSANKANFTMNATKTIYGGGLVGGGSTPSTKDDQAGGGVLYCESQFASGSKPVVDDDVLKVTITITGADA